MWRKLFAEERHIRTFVVVKRGGRWLIMQDYNTAVVEFPPKITRVWQRAHGDDE